jgi:hypothetical protein
MFAWEDPDPDDVETLVELSLRNLGKSTEVVLTQGPFKAEARARLLWYTTGIPSSSGR